MAKRRNGVFDWNAEKVKIIGESAILGTITTQNCLRNPSAKVTWYSASGGERSIRVRGKRMPVESMIIEDVIRES